MLILWIIGALVTVICFVRAALPHYPNDETGLFILVLFALIGSAIIWPLFLATLLIVWVVKRYDNGS